MKAKNVALLALLTVVGSGYALQAQPPDAPPPPDASAQAGAQVDATIEGALRDGTHSTQSDELGRAQIQFPLPPLGKGDLALVIQAKADAHKDEIRFSMRTRQKPAEAEATKPL